MHIYIYIYKNRNRSRSRAKARWRIYIYIIYIYPEHEVLAGRTWSCCELDGSLDAFSLQATDIEELSLTSLTSSRPAHEGPTAEFFDLVETDSSLIGRFDMQRTILANHARCVFFGWRCFMVDLKLVVWQSS